MQKKAIILVSFGTTHIDTREKTIDKLFHDIEKEFPEYDVFQSYTSHIVRKRIFKNEGIEYLNPGDMIESLVESGYEEIYVQPSHVICGSEYNKINMYKKRFVDREFKLRTGKPLLNNKTDFDNFINHLKLSYSPEKENEITLFMAHGTDSNAFTSYVTLSHLLKDTNIYVRCVEGYPELNKSTINELKEKGIKKIKLYPLMLVAGDHAKNDMASETPNSWKTLLEQEGFEVEAIVQGLGEDNKIREIYINHLRNIIEKRSRCRHAG